MLRHVIIWKLKDGLADLASVKAGIKEGLEGLVGQVPGLLRVKVYIEGADPSMVMLDSYLASAEALKGYATHPAHVAVANAKVRPYTQARHCLDFEGDSEFSELVWERRSFRKFKADLPAKELVDEVVRAGLLAPTGRNKQSSVVLRIDDSELREEIRAKNAEIMGAPPPGRPADPFYAAPVMLLVIANKANNTGVYDGSLTMGNMMLKAHELGLAACWIHRAKEELESPLGQKILAKAGLEGEWEGVGHLALGYADMPLPEPHPYNAARYITI